MLHTSRYRRTVRLFTMHSWSSNIIWTCNRICLQIKNVDDNGLCSEPPNRHEVRESFVDHLKTDIQMKKSVKLSNQIFEWILFSTFPARTWYLRSFAFLLDFECLRRKWCTIVASQLIANTNRVDIVLYSMNQIDWSFEHQAHTARKWIWSSKIAHRTKRQFQVNLNHRPTLETRKDNFTILFYGIC